MKLPLFLSNYLHYLPLPFSDTFKLLLIVFAIYLPFYLDGSEYSSASRYNSYLHSLFRYFGLIFYRLLGLKPRVIVENHEWVKSSKHKQFIFASHPHGVMSFHHGMFYMNNTGSEILNQLIPLNKRRALAARPLFSIPILRDIILSCGAVDASLPTAKQCLAAGYSLTILPGGEQEQLLAQHNQHHIYIQHRKGFCRLSIQYNIPILPCYCFGETSTHHTSSIYLSLRQWIAKKFFLALPLPLPSGWTFLFPLSTSLSLHIGQPIFPPPRDDTLPLEEDNKRRVEKLHQEYLTAIKGIFEENKERYGIAKEVELKIS